MREGFTWAGVVLILGGAFVMSASLLVAAALMALGMVCIGVGVR